MNRPARDTFLTSCLDEGIQQTEGVNFGLKIVVEHGLESRHLRIHNHNVGGDASLAKGDALVGHCHSKIVDTVILQCLGNLHSTCSIGVGLDHAHHLRLGLEEGTVVVQVLHHGVEIHLKDGLMHLLFQLFRDLIEAERTSAFQENQFIVQVVECVGGQEMVHISEELLIGDLDPVCLGREFRADTDEFVDATLETEVGDLGVELVRGRTGLEHVGENESLVQTPPSLP